VSIVARIRAQGGEVIRDGWSFRLRAGRLSKSAVAWIRDHRREVMREVWPEFDAWEERAAIREYDGGEDRQTAERNAYVEVTGC